jgi:hypothetical protein
MAKHHQDLVADTPVLSALTPGSFWQLPLADREWLAYACGVSTATAQRMIDVLGADTVRIGARTFVFPQRMAAQIEAFADRVAAANAE